MGLIAPLGLVMPADALLLLGGGGTGIPSAQKRALSTVIFSHGPERRKTARRVTSFSEKPHVELSGEEHSHPRFELVVSQVIHSWLHRWWRRSSSSQTAFHTQVLYTTTPCPRCSHVCWFLLGSNAKTVIDGSETLSVEFFLSPHLPLAPFDPDPPAPLPEQNTCDLIFVLPGKPLSSSGENETKMRKKLK